MAGPSGTTSRLLLPFPTPADNVDVPRDVQALADKLDLLTSLVPLVSSLPLPASPANGQEIYFQDASMATAAIIWHLRFSTASGAWEFVGGAPYHLSANTSRTSSATAYAIPSTDPLSVTVPPGTYDVMIEGDVTPTATGAAFHSYSVGAVPPQDAWAVRAASAVITVSGAKSWRHAITSGAFTEQIRSGTAGQTIAVMNRHMIVQPVRLDS